MFKDTKNGQTNFCEACEAKARGINLKFKHTCGLAEPQTKKEQLDNLTQRVMKKEEIINELHKLCSEWNIEEVQLLEAFVKDVIKIAYEEGYEACSEAEGN
jgi:hypothetical protein